MSANEIAASHRITVEFLGTDAEAPIDQQCIYSVSCSCGAMSGTLDAVSHRGADGRIRRHLEEVGLTESFTQR